MRIFQIGIVALAVAGCGQAANPGAGAETSVPSPPVEPASTTSIPSPDPSMPSETDPIAAATDDLSIRLEVDPASISVVETREEQWPDGSLGCPQEGELYTQALVDGTQIFLSVGDRLYDYRADSDGNVKLCPSEEKDGGREFLPPPGADES